MHNIAVIGAGRIGRIHASNAKADPRIELKFVVDPIGSSRTARTNRIYVTPGDQVRMVIPP